MAAGAPYQVPYLFIDLSFHGGLAKEDPGQRDQRRSAAAPSRIWWSKKGMR